MWVLFAMHCLAFETTTREIDIAFSICCISTKQVTKLQNDELSHISRKTHYFSVYPLWIR